MLIEFNVGNYRSFWKSQSLKMTADTKPELRDQNTFKSRVSGVPNLLRSAVVYGPNAAGKSNIVTAMQFMREFVMVSAKVFTWFQRLKVIEHGTYLHPGFSIEQCLDDKGKETILDFMNAADLSIKDIDIETRKFSDKDLPSGMPPALKEELRKDLADKKKANVKFLHPVHKTNDSVWLPIEEESDGTQKLFAYAAPWLDLLSEGRILFVDEFDNNLHSKIIVFLLELLHNSETNKKNGQVVFTTHNTSFLDKNLLRRDQVWFVEKNEQNATNLYPLPDFSPRKGEALQKGYLQGRYGALPYVSKAGIHGV